MLPGLSVIGIIVIVLLLTVVLNYGLFKPVMRVLDERELAIRSAGDAANEAAAKSRAAAEEFERRTRAVQAEGYQAMEERRRDALEHREELLARTRQDVDCALAEAAASLRAQVAEARAELEKDREALADAVVERVLGRRAS